MLYESTDYQDFVQIMNEGVFTIKIPLDKLIKSFIFTNDKKNGLCPFHIPHSYSLKITKDFFECDECNMSGTHIDFISRIRRCSTLESINFLLKRYEIQIPQELQKKLDKFNKEANINATTRI